MKLIYFVSIFLIVQGLKIDYLQDDPVPQTQWWFENQKLNHFDPTDIRVWRQRYWSVDQYFDQQNGAVLLLICGEYVCPGVRESRQFPVQLAEQHKALILVLEHRYYGLSMPLGNESLKIDNMKYLSVRQAMDDLAYFINFIRQNNLFGVSSITPWISIGGSYPGAMAAWLQYQYPHLVIGSLASSAVVNIMVDFPDFDKQIYLSSQKSGDQCTKDLQDMTAYAEQQIEGTEGQAFKKRFNEAEQLNDDEFMFMFADAIVLTIQYGGRTKLCDGILGKPIDEQIDFLIQVSKGEAEPQSYGSYYLKNETFDPTNLSSSRQWMYQCCSEVGFWQTPSQIPMRSARLDINFYKKFCQDSFGQTKEGHYVWPDQDRFNAYFGGKYLNVPNLIFTNGNEDPWKWASLVEPQGDMTVREIDCDNAGHCVELYTPKAEDCQALKDVRTEIDNLFGQWILDHYNSIQQ